MALGDNIEIITKVATLKANGFSQKEIGNEIGTSQRTISTLLNPSTDERRDLLKSIVEQTRNEIILKSLPKVQQNVQTCIENALIPPEQERTSFYTDQKGIEHEVESKFSEDIRYWGLRYSEKMLESIGILGSQAPSIFIQQIFNPIQQIINNPLIQRFLDGNKAEDTAEENPDYNATD